MNEIINIIENRFNMKDIKMSSRGGLFFKNEEYRIGMILTKSKIIYLDTKEIFLSDMCDSFKSKEMVGYIENKTTITEENKNEIINIIEFLNENRENLVKSKSRKKKKDPVKEIKLKMPKIDCKITEKQELVLNEMEKFLKDENMLNKEEVIKSIVENHNISEKVAKGVLGSLVAKKLIFINGKYIGFMNL